MVNFIVYDLILLTIFVIAVGLFLFRRRKNLQKEGLLFLYRTEHGIKLIKKIGEKYQKTLKFLSYVSITLGFALMAGILYMFGKIVWIYISQQAIVRAVKIPPILPLVPYLPQIFKLDFLPPFFFTYWIVIIAIIAITHEFSHGIFAAYNKVRIKKTGFGFFPFFLPIFLAAFVELDEKVMATKKKINQMAILSAGTFANVLTGVVFFFVLWGFFAVSFAPAGVTFDTYSYSIVNMSDIKSIDGVNFLIAPTPQQILGAVHEKGLSTIRTYNNEYKITKDFLDKQQNIVNYVLLYDDSPALEANITGAITSINGVKIDSREKLSQLFYTFSPGEKIKVTTKTDAGNTYNYDITLGQNPSDKTIPFLGVAFTAKPTNGVTGIINKIVYLIKKPNIFYEPVFDSALFIYNLLWWLVLISFSVALVNMLPMGIFDGGRFLFLTIWGITKSKKAAEIAFKIMTYLLLFLVLVVMVFWALRIFF